MTKTTKTIGLFFASIVYFLLCYYIGNNIVFSLSAFLPNSIIVGIMIWYSVFCFSLLLSFVPINNRYGTIIRNLGMTWLGAFIYLLIFFFASDTIKLIWEFLFDAPFAINALYLVSIIATLCLVIYGCYNNKKLNITTYKTGFLDSKDGLRVVYVSDLHIGAVNSEKYLVEVVKNINKQNADIVCLVGDIFDGNANLIQHPSKVSNLLLNIQSKYGVYACLGNHDAGNTYNKMLAFLRNSNVTVLNEQCTVINGQYVLVGRMDAFPIGGYGEHAGRDIMDKVMDEARLHNLPIIVMDHTPPKYTGVNSVHHYYGDVLLLCGHTHRGQIWPFGYITRKMFLKDYGYISAKNNDPCVIVSSGAGTWGMPMKICSIREIVCVDIDS